MSEWVKFHNGGNIVDNHTIGSFGIACMTQNDLKGWDLLYEIMTEMMPLSVNIRIPNMAMTSLNPTLRWQRAWKELGNPLVQHVKRRRINREHLVLYKYCIRYHRERTPHENIEFLWIKDNDMQGNGTPRA